MIIEALGLVPAPKAGDQDKFLCIDGTWKEANNYDFFLCETGDWMRGNNSFKFLGGDGEWWYLYEEKLA